MRVRTQVCIFRHPSAQGSDSARCICIRKAFRSNNPCVGFLDKVREIRVIAFYGESLSQLHIRRIHSIWDISRPSFRGIPHHLKKVFSICLLPETQKIPKNS